MYYFYILFSEKDSKCYYGSTKDLQQRIQSHDNGHVQSTKHRRPLKLFYYEAYQSLEQARSREQQVKSSGSIRNSLLKRINMMGH